MISRAIQAVGHFFKLLLVLNHVLPVNLLVEGPDQQVAKKKPDAKILESGFFLFDLLV